MDPSCIRQPVGLFTKSNTGNGDCLFLAIAQALNSYEGMAADAMAAHLQTLGLRAGAVTCTALRNAVYSLFLMQAAETDAILDAWCMTRAASPELAAEYMHVMALPANTPAAHLTYANRLAFFAACMNPRVCWGDETALEILECILSIRCLVVVKKRLQTRSLLRHPDNFKPLLFIPLSLSNLHYQSVVWEDEEGVEHAAFSEAEIPDILLFLTQRDCGMVDAPYIHLKHRIAERVKGLAMEAREEEKQVATAPIPPHSHYSFDDKMVRQFLSCQQLLPVPA